MQETIGGSRIMLLASVIKKVAPPPAIESFDRFLFLGPHPDDIEIGAGATIAKLAGKGKKITFLICTDGRFGLDFVPKGTTPEELIEIRKKESIAAAARLGVTDVRFLGFSDGGAYQFEDLKKGIARMIGEVQPEVIFAPDPCVDSECHTDHLNVGEAARRMAFFAPFSQIMAGLDARSADVQALAYYMTAKPNQYIRIGSEMTKQFKSIQAHVSQFPKNSDAFKQVALYLKLRSLYFGAKSLKGKAEGFRVLGKVQMHCLPEAGLK